MQLDISIIGLPIKPGFGEHKTSQTVHAYRTFNRPNRQLLEFQAVCLRVIYLVVVHDSHIPSIYDRIDQRKGEKVFFCVFFDVEISNGVYLILKYFLSKRETTLWMNLVISINSTMK